MAERRILVIGSQCEAIKPPLSFLPDAAEKLYKVMIDPALGACTPALLDGGLLIDPTVSQAKESLRAAFKLASDGEATLFIAYVGHGDHVGNDFYLLPTNAPIVPDSDTAIHLVQRIKELHRQYSNTDGLVLLLDTCSSGVAASAAVSGWVSELKGTLRFEILTATDERKAAKACFSRTLVDVIQKGLTKVPGNTLRSEDLREVLLKRCPNQLPQLPIWNRDLAYTSQRMSRAVFEQASRGNRLKS